jgi:hypothetical protein
VPEIKYTTVQFGIEFHDKDLVVNGSILRVGGMTFKIPVTQIAQFRGDKVVSFPGCVLQEATEDGNLVFTWDDERRQKVFIPLSLIRRVMYATLGIVT